MAPLYLYTNKSPLLTVVVNTGATSPVCSYAALKVIVLLPVPSCINSIEINCPVWTPEAAPNVLLPARVTFATGAVNAFQEIVEASVNATSALKAAAVNLAKPWPPVPSLISNTDVPSYCWKIISLPSTWGLNIKSLDEFIILSKLVPPEANTKSLPAASNVISAAASIDLLYIDAQLGVPIALPFKVTVNGIDVLFDEMEPSPVEDK